MGLAACAAMGRAAQKASNKATHPWGHRLLGKGKVAISDGQTKLTTNMQAIIGAACMVIVSGRIGCDLDWAHDHLRTVAAHPI
jgi:hypothetical protein